MSKVIEALTLAVAFICGSYILFLAVATHIGAYILQQNSHNSLSASSDPFFTTLRLVAEFLYYPVLIGGGVITGYLVRRGSLLWGAALGIILFLLSIVFYTLLITILSEEFTIPSETFSNVERLPLIIALTTVGAFLGERIAAFKKHQQKK